MNLYLTRIRKLIYKQTQKKIEYMPMSRNQNTRTTHNSKIVNDYFENVVKFRYFGDESNKSELSSRRNKNRFNSENACYQSFQNL